MNDPYHSLSDLKYWVLETVLSHFELTRLPPSCFNNGHMRGIVFLQMQSDSRYSLKELKYFASAGTLAEIFEIASKETLVKSLSQYGCSPELYLEAIKSIL